MSPLRICMFLLVHVRVCTGWCDVITLMVFHWDWSLNEDIKAVGCFYMHGRVTRGGHSCFKSSLMHNGRGTHKCIPVWNHNKWAKYAWMGLCTYVKEECIDSFVFFFFSSMWTNIRKHSLGPSLSLLSISIPSQAWLIKIFMSRPWHACHYFHYCYYAFQAGNKKTTLTLVEVFQKLSVLQSSDWFMIDAEHTWALLKLLRGTIL